MKKWMDHLSEVEIKSIEKIPNHANYYTYSDKHNIHHLVVDEKELCFGKEIEIFANGDYAVTKDYDTWTLYRDKTVLCTGVWVTSHMDGSYKYKFYNDSFNKYVIRSTTPDGEYEDEIEGHEEHTAEQGDYNVM